MASLLPIVKYGSNKILVQPAQKITTFGFSNELKVLTDDMFATMYAAKGIGLAAPQVGMPSRIAVIDISGGQDPDMKLILINPEIKKSRWTQEVEEGCLSIPGQRATIKRAKQVWVEAQNLQGEVFTIWGKDLLAQALQHEIDHLNGILYLSHVEKK